MCLEGTMKVKEIMDKYPVTVQKDTTLQVVAEELSKHRVTSLPVVSEDGKLEGIISEGDLLYKKIRPHTPEYLNLLGASIFYGGLGKFDEEFHKLLGTHVADIMTYDVVTCSEDDDVEDVALIMVEKHLKMLPVVDANRVIGVVSRTDIIALIAQEK